VITDRTRNGLTFKNRKDEEYKFNDNKEDTAIAHPENVSFLVIPTETPGILTKQEETQGVNAIQDKPKQSNEKHALLAVEDFELQLGAVDIPERCEVTKLLNDNEEKSLNNFI
jgi:hypothetical protein